jgi:hypothetical protein
MGRRKKNEPSVSTDWRSYSPFEAYYWKFGGPVVEPEDIPARRVNPANIGTHYKGQDRVKFIAALLTRTEGELAATIARYRALKAYGMEALHESTQEYWRRQVHAGNVRPDEPDPVSEHLTYAYRGIGDLKGRLEIYCQLLDDLERDGRPLLHWKD